MFFRYSWIAHCQQVSQIGSSVVIMQLNSMSAEGEIGMFLEVFTNTFAEEGDCLLSEWNAWGSAAACALRKHRAIRSLP